MKLSPREVEVGKLLITGCENKDIAKELSIATRTVKAHMNRLFLKFGIEDGGIKRVRLATLLYRNYPEWRQ